MRGGQRVKFAPHSDVFMMGESYGTILSVGISVIVVQGERSGRKFKFPVGSDSLEVVS